MAEEVSAGAIPTDTNSGVAPSKGLAELGYDRTGYLDRTYLDSLLVPVGQLVTTVDDGTVIPINTDISAKVAQYAAEREANRIATTEGYINEYLTKGGSTQNLYKDLYDGYLLSNPTDNMSQAEFVRRVTNIDSKIKKDSITTALDNKLGEWTSEPNNFRSDLGKTDLTWDNTSITDFTMSGGIGDVMGWSSDSYDRLYAATGLEGFAERSRTVAAREEAARKAQLEALIASQGNNLNTYRQAYSEGIINDSDLFSGMGNAAAPTGEGVLKDIDFGDLDVSGWDVAFGLGGFALNAALPGLGTAVGLGRAAYNAFSDGEADQGAGAGYGSNLGGDTGSYGGSDTSGNSGYGR